MRPTNSLIPILILSLFFTILFLCSADSDPSREFHQCLIRTQPSISRLIYTPSNSSFTEVLFAYIQNQRHTSPVPDPLFIITPLRSSHIRTTIRCAESSHLQLRIRSGGHDFEGLSYISQLPYAIVDLFNLRSISVDVEHKTAWVQAGATLGEVYYAVSNASRKLGFPAGYWSTVGVGGHLSGGGYGPLIRKYGIASDNIVDAKIITVNGSILDKGSMGEDLFWAIRGGGGGNFGVVFAWKIRLVDVPEIVTVCTLPRTVEQNVTDLVHKWQYVAHKMPRDLLIELHLATINATGTPSGQNTPTIQASFEPVFLGKFDGLFKLMNERFPELGVTRNECNETSWIDAVLRLAFFPAGSPPEILLNRTATRRRFTKQKSDYVEEPIPKEALEGLWQVFYRIDVGSPQMTWTPYGGRMSEISKTETPYPHRSRNIFMIFESVSWNGTQIGASSPRHIDWIRGLHDYMTDYVAKSPRSSYANYRDLDLGENNVEGNTSYAQAAIWGEKYFRDNFRRLVQVKAAVDPGNFFRNEQSIPICSS